MDFIALDKLVKDSIRLAIYHDANDPRTNEPGPYRILATKNGVSIIASGESISDAMADLPIDQLSQYFDNN